MVLIMVKFEKDKEYLLNIREAEPVKAIYLGIKTYKRVLNKHAFLSYGFRKNRVRVYLGNVNKSNFKEGIVHLKYTKTKSLNRLEEKLIEHLINRLRKQ